MHCVLMDLFSTLLITFHNDFKTFHPGERSGEDQISNLHEFDLAKRHLVLQWRYADGGGGV